MPSAPLTPAQKSLRARLAAQSLHAQVDSREHTAPARRAGPGATAYWVDRVDPDRALPEAERLRRADHAKKAYFTKLALASSRARSRKAAS